MRVLKDALQGFQFCAFLLMALVLVFSIIPVHGQSIASEIILEHRLTFNEQQTANLVQGLSDVKTQIAGIETKVMLAVSGIAMLLIKAAVNIFMEKFFPGSKPV